MHPPEGGFYLFLDFTPLVDVLARRGIKDSTGLCERLLMETGVAILPGVVFGRPSGELTARLSYVNFDGAKALAHSETIPLHLDLPQDFIPKICEETLAGTWAIVDWLLEK